MEARALLGLALVATALAGCIASPAPSQAPSADLLPAEAPRAPLSIALADCREGGGHSIYNLDLIQGLMPEPWVLADVRGDTGDVTLQNTVPPLPTEGELSGIYHAAFSCASHAIDGVEKGPLAGGYVGIRVQPPAFDPGGAARHYVVVTFATDSEEVNGLLTEAGYHVAASNVVVEDQGPLLHTVLDDAEHGVYEVLFQPVEAGPKEDGIVRLWIQLGAEEHHGDVRAQAHDAPQIKPVALDLVDVGGTHVHAQDTSAVFSHTRTTDHDQDLGFAVVPIPGAGGNTGGLGYYGFSRTITVGPWPGVAFEEAWDHV